jgi:hypothetical protein
LQKVIKRERIHSGPTPRDPGRNGQKPTARPAARKGARLIHVDGRLQAIEVTCACGDVMVIEIEYESEAVPEESVS